MLSGAGFWVKQFVFVSRRSCLLSRVPTYSLVVLHGMVLRGIVDT